MPGRAEAPSGTGEAFFTNTASTPRPLRAPTASGSYLSRRGFLQAGHGFSQLAV